MFINLFQGGHLDVSFTVEWILARQFERMRGGWKWLRVVLVMDRDEGEFWISNICFTVARNGFRMHLKTEKEGILYRRRQMKVSRQQRKFAFYYNKLKLSAVQEIR